MHNGFLLTGPFVYLILYCNCMSLSRLAAPSLACIATRRLPRHSPPCNTTAEVEAVFGAHSHHYSSVSTWLTVITRPTISRMHSHVSATTAGVVFFSVPTRRRLISRTPRCIVDPGDTTHLTLVMHYRTDACKQSPEAENTLLLVVHSGRVHDLPPTVGRLRSLCVCGSAYTRLLGRTRFSLLPRLLGVNMGCQ